MKVGNLVKCIDGKFTSDQVFLIPNRPEEQRIYEVRKVLFTRNGKAILLVEIENPLITDEVSKLKFEPSFRVNRFVIVDDSSGNNVKEYVEELLNEEVY
jgi:hypothetical protein